MKIRLVKIRNRKHTWNLEVVENRQGKGNEIFNVNMSLRVPTLSSAGSLCSPFSFNKRQVVGGELLRQKKIDRSQSFCPKSFIQGVSATIGRESEVVSQSRYRHRDQTTSPRKRRGKWGWK